MKTRTQVSADKLRGGFYTPAPLVAACFDRLQALMPAISDARFLEPSVGDGAFIRGLAKAPLLSSIGYIEGLEVLAAEGAKAAEEIRSVHIPGRIQIESALSWALVDRPKFDVAAGNPPFVRFQFLTEDDKRDLRELGARLGVSFRGVSNLWSPVLLAALASLRVGGVFAFVVPSELFTGTSARTVRDWLCRHAVDLRVDLYPPGSFPGVLQEVVVLSGRRAAVIAGPRLTLFETDSLGGTREWSHTISREASTWTRFLLPPDELEALETCVGRRGIVNLSELAKFEVAAVTGANEFFAVSEQEAAEFELSTWVRPLLSRARLAVGLRYTAEDHRRAMASGASTGLLDFSAELPDPLQIEGARRYLQSGVEAGLDLRYKTRIREPWFRVPYIRPGRLMLSKRSHRYPRLILNDAAAVTTDTLYRGWMQPQYRGREEDLTASFHNSLTMLSAEVEGRSFGGGVLELVPSEVGRLAVPLVSGAGLILDELSGLTGRSTGEVTDRLVDRTDALLLEHGKIEPNQLDRLRSGRRRLQRRRLDRSEGERPAEAVA